MFKELAQLDTNLRRAGYVLLIVVLGGALLALLLYQFNLASLAVLFVWAVNLPAAWFLSQAAKLQGRSAWRTGFVSLIPVAALFEFFILCPGSPRTKPVSSR
jgi:hypothetical protein